MACNIRTYEVWYGYKHIFDTRYTGSPVKPVRDFLNVLAYSSMYLNIWHIGVIFVNIRFTKSCKEGLNSDGTDKVYNTIHYRDKQFFLKDKQS